jgi:hypothetical protein
MEEIIVNVEEMEHNNNLESGEDEQEEGIEIFMNILKTFQFN